MASYRFHPSPLRTTTPLLAPTQNSSLNSNRAWRRSEFSSVANPYPKMFVGRTQGTRNLPDFQKSLIIKQPPNDAQA